MRLTKVQKTAIELLLEGDLTIEEIAQSVKKSRQTVYNWLKNPDFEAEYSERLQDIERRTRRRISRMVDTALDRQEEILTRSRNDNAAAVVAKDVLDRAGYMPEENVKVSGGETVNIIFDIPKSGKASETDRE